MIGHKPPIQKVAFSPQYMLCHRYACVVQLRDTAPRDDRVRITAAYHDMTDTSSDDEVCAGRCLAMMGTGFEADIDRRLSDQVAVMLFDTADTVDLGMSLAVLLMVALAYDTPFMD
jgi:hypothetical protein